MTQKWAKLHQSPKKGSLRSNYRPIFLTSICSKFMDHVLYSHIATFLTSVNVFHHITNIDLSCDSQLALFINDISSNLDRKIPVDALFLDFENAFDKVPHRWLLLKLSRLHLNPLVLYWIHNFSTDNSLCTLTTTPPLKAPCFLEYPKAQSLGPLFFLYILMIYPLNFLLTFIFLLMIVSYLAQSLFVPTTAHCKMILTKLPLGATCG